MRFTKLLLNSTSLTLINWLFFALVFCWASLLNKNILWWLDLHWYSWLTELEALVLLRVIPAGSVWILWLMLSILLTVAWLAARMVKAQELPKTTTTPVHVAEEIPKEIESASIKARVDIPETTPELREKIQRLHESLNKI